MRYTKRSLWDYNSPSRLRSWSWAGFSHCRSLGRCGWGFIIALALCLGCEQVDPTEAYTTRSLYSGDLKTVYIEMFENQILRREIEFELTRAIGLQLETHSELKIVSNRQRADSVLYGSILGVSETVLSSSHELGRPVQNEVAVFVEVTWKDLRSAELILDKQLVRATGTYVALLAAGRQSASRQAAEQIAVKIVEAMQAPW